MATKRKKDYTGLACGVSVILAPANERNRFNQELWILKCECGSLRKLAAHQFKANKSGRCRKCTQLTNSKEELFTRFYANVQPEPNTGCWFWDGSLRNDGYGQFAVNGKQHGSHRLSYQLHKGPIPLGMQVCHTCDTPSCVNPDHLWLGTPKDNAVDKVAKGRINPAFGEANGGSKLTNEQIILIRELYEAKHLNQRELGEKFSVAHQTISKIVRKERWVR